MINPADYICFVLIPTNDDYNYKEDIFFINATYEGAIRVADKRLSSYPEGSTYALYELKMYLED